MKTLKQIDREIKAIERQRAALYKKIKPLEEMREDLIAKEKIRNAKYKVGQRVEYRLDGCKVVHFGIVAAINTKRWGDAKYLVERIDSKGERVGFGNEVMDREIFGSSHK